MAATKGPRGLQPRQGFRVSDVQSFGFLGVIAERKAGRTLFVFLCWRSFLSLSYNNARRYCCQALLIRRVGRVPQNAEFLDLEIAMKRAVELMIKIAFGFGLVYLAAAARPTAFKYYESSHHYGWINDEQAACFL
jgi:hypothetical protein